MSDTLYVLGSIAWFALMLAFVRGCARLGATGGASTPSDEQRP